MPRPDKTTDHGTLRRLVDVGADAGAAGFEPGAAVGNPADKRSATASVRMKRVHEAAAYDHWFREQVQAAIDDPRPSVDDGAARLQFAARRAALAPSTGGARKVARKAAA